MAKRTPKRSTPPHMVPLLGGREIDAKIARKVQASLQITESLVMRLGLEAELEGHSGCVNCLEWNEAGTVLASASDDVRFILWDPFRHKIRHIFETGHQGNIFSVKFLPNSNDNTVVTGAGDCRVRVHDVVINETTSVCACHTGRIKRIATAPNAPFIFWTAAEDGLIMEFDLRTPHRCDVEWGSVLINLGSQVHRFAEGKCLAINPFRPELLAVGVNDPYARLYDRRMIRPVSIQYSADGKPVGNYTRYRYMESQFDSNLSLGCVQYFVAGHLPSKHKDMREKNRSLSCTYLTFSPSGNELLVNLGGEQIYLFDINNKQPLLSYGMYSKDLEPGSEEKPTCLKTDNGLSINGFHNTGSQSVSGQSQNQPEPPPRKMATVQGYQFAGDQAMELKHFTSAIRMYSKTINMCPNWAVAYNSRAVAYMRRGWDGDMYAALRDCRQTLKLDPSCFKAQFRLSKCLLELKLLEEASDCLSDFKAKFPEQSYSRACKALDLEIHSMLSDQGQHSTSERLQSEGDDCLSESEDEKLENGRSKHRYGTWDKISREESYWRVNANDYETRFCGHCNTTTDIKEANFFGRDGQFVVAGSDDGSFFVWDRETANILQVLKGDESIVNCLQPHPSACLLATSGIESVVRLWSPLPEDGERNCREVLNLDDAASANQRRMNADPFEQMLQNIAVQIPTTGIRDSIPPPSQCNNS